MVPLSREEAGGAACPLILHRGRAKIWMRKEQAYFIFVFISNASRHVLGVRQLAGTALDLPAAPEIGVLTIPSSYRLNQSQYGTCTVSHSGVHRL